MKRKSADLLRCIPGLKIETSIPDWGTQFLFSSPPALPARDE